MPRSQGRVAVFNQWSYMCEPITDVKYHGEKVRRSTKKKLFYIVIVLLLLFHYRQLNGEKKILFFA